MKEEQKKEQPLLQKYNVREIFEVPEKFNRLWVSIDPIVSGDNEVGTVIIGSTLPSDERFLGIFKNPTQYNFIPFENIWDEDHSVKGFFKPAYYKTYNFTPMTDIQIENTARTAHEINRAYCSALGDNSQPSWEEAPDWQKDSARNGVKFHSQEPRTAEESHESWIKQKEEEGWKYGPVKDADKKEHPCFLPYHQLPEEQKVKDYLFKAVIESMLKNIRDERTTLDQKLDASIAHAKMHPDSKSKAMTITSLEAAKLWNNSEKILG